ncbi:hypothetical protein EG347_15960 [Chryseobacterium sp. G0186]|uniref:hypothetical protein n=1 Tax=Chryseobacterium sp. G0186 TaxID=2487064 RepID=UPI000F4FD525|nr:hypothetical protein [Chryseobacterium sp. G0186]AZA78898.1 hypothetical protein EG347_15960 [Chryseobacterium sp. G0186]
MKISNINIITMVNVLYYSGRVTILILALMALFIILGPRTHPNNPWEITLLIFAAVLSFVIGYLGSIALKNYLVSRSKYPLVLTIICNVLKISRNRITNKPIDIDLDQFIKDNNLSLTYYYVNNPTYPILSFNKNKIRYFTQEYDWVDFKWDFYFQNAGRTTLEILDFRGFNQENRSIKDRIEFEKIEAREHEILIMFIVHDLLFGKGLSRYY